MEKNLFLSSFSSVVQPLCKMPYLVNMKKAQPSDFQMNCASVNEVGSRFELLYTVLQTAA